MNEISLLLHLLSRRNDIYHIGATKEDILNALNLTYKNSAVYFHNLITHLSHIIEPLGLQIRFNPINSYWFIIFESETSNLIISNPFTHKPSLAATLFCILALCLKNSGFAPIHEVGKLRRKKTIMKDIKELEKLGYILYNKKLNRITLTPLIGYQLDMEKLFVKLSLRFQNEENK